MPLLTVLVPHGVYQPAIGFVNYSYLGLFCALMRMRKVLNAVYSTTVTLDTQTGADGISFLRASRDGTTLLDIHTKELDASVSILTTIGKIFKTEMVDVRLIQEE